MKRAGSIAAEMNGSPQATRRDGHGHGTVSLKWPNYLRDWAEREGLHPGDVLLRLLDERLERQNHDTD